MNKETDDKKEAEDDSLNPQPPDQTRPGDYDRAVQDDTDGTLEGILDEGQKDEKVTPHKKPRRGKFRKKRTKSKPAATTAPRPSIKEKSPFDLDMKNEDLKELFQTGSVLIALSTKSANWLMPDEIAAKMSSAYVKALTLFAPKITPEILALINVTAVTLQYVYGAAFGRFISEKSKFSFAGKKDAGDMVSDKLNKIHNWFSKNKVNKNDAG